MLTIFGIDRKFGGCFKIVIMFPQHFEMKKTKNGLTKKKVDMELSKLNEKNRKMQTELEQIYKLNNDET